MPRNPVQEMIAQQAQQVQVVPKQTIYPQVQISVAPQPDGSQALIITTPLDGVIVFPMDPASCEIIGKALLAPHVVTPNGNAPGGPLG